MDWNILSDDLAICWATDIHPNRDTYRPKQKCYYEGEPTGLHFDLFRLGNVANGESARSQIAKLELAFVLL